MRALRLFLLYISTSASLKFDCLLLLSLYKYLLANGIVLLAAHGACHNRTTLLFEAVVLTAQLWLVCVCVCMAIMPLFIIQFHYCCCGRKTLPLYALFNVFIPPFIYYFFSFFLSLFDPFSLYKLCCVQMRFSYFIRISREPATLERYAIFHTTSTHKLPFFRYLMVTPAISYMLEDRKRKEMEWSLFFHLFESTVFRLVGMWRHLLHMRANRIQFI